MMEAMFPLALLASTILLSWCQEVSRRKRIEKSRREAVFAFPDNELLEAMREVDALTPQVSPMAPPRLSPARLAHAAGQMNASVRPAAGPQYDGSNPTGSYVALDGCPIELHKAFRCNAGKAAN